MGAMLGHRGLMMGPSLEAQVRAMYAGGVPGVMIDPWQMSNCYQDATLTTLVDTLGQPIGSTVDLSGNGKHPAQATPTSRPLFQNGAQFDGADDGWVTPSIDFSSTDAVTVVASVRKLSDAAVGLIAELGAIYTSSGGFVMQAPGSAATGSALFGSSGTSGPTFAWKSSGVVSPTSLVLTGQGKISADVCALRINGANAATSAVDQGAGNYRNSVVNIGSRNGGASAFFNGLQYRLAVIGRALSPSELSIAERWANQPVGVL